MSCLESGRLASGAIAWIHVLIFSEQHLRQVLKSYALYYNEARAHLGLSKDTPPPRTIQCSRIISATPVLSGLPHRYARI
jgi:hypothetical protein